MVIVKLGGSLYQSTDLMPCLQSLVKLSEQQPIIIVPGGGPFADQVRHTQQHYQFDDSYAHQMAILAMAQFGLLLLGQEPKSKPYYLQQSSDELPPLSVFIPDKSLFSQQALPHSWDISADSIALWLAQQLSASQLLLVKRLMPQQLSIAELSSNGIIDRGFATLFQQNKMPTRIINASEIEQLDLHSASGLITL